MGKILYGVMGDRGGHLSRSLAIAQQLKGHEIVFVGGGRVGEVTRNGYSVVKIPMMGTELSGHRIDVAATAMNALRGMAQRSGAINQLTGVIRDFDPDLIITDFEYFLPQAAKRLGRSVISIDRHHVLTNCSYRSPPGHLVSRVLTTSVIRAIRMTASRYLICSFLPMHPIDPEITEIFPSVLRREVEDIKPCAGEHVLVYLYGISIDWIRKTLGGRRRTYVIYGQGVTGIEENLTFRPYSIEGFLTDLASSAYVISHGGHNLISEALHLGKPLLCYPIGLEYEQLFNAHLLDKTGYGAWGKTRAGAAPIDGFEAKLPEYREKLAGYRPWSSHTIAERLEQLIAGSG